jgi:hypothetical protein
MKALRQLFLVGSLLLVAVIIMGCGDSDPNSPRNKKVCNVKDDNVEVTLTANRDSFVAKFFICHEARYDEDVKFPKCDQEVILKELNANCKPDSTDPIDVALRDGLKPAWFHHLDPSVKLVGKADVDGNGVFRTITTSWKYTLDARNSTNDALKMGPNGDVAKALNEAYGRIDASFASISQSMIRLMNGIEVLKRVKEISQQSLNGVYKGWVMAKRGRTEDGLNAVRGIRASLDDQLILARSECLAAALQAVYHSNLAAGSMNEALDKLQDASRGADGRVGNKVKQGISNLVLARNAAESGREGCKGIYSTLSCAVKEMDIGVRDVDEALKTVGEMKR